MVTKSTNKNGIFSLVFILVIFSILIYFVLFGFDIKIFNKKSSNSNVIDDDTNYNSINSLLLDYNIGTVRVGDSLRLRVSGYSMENNNSLEWSSSNSEIATVNKNGVVNALKQGSVTITVSNGNLSDSVVINIKDKIDLSLVDVKYEISSIQNDGTILFDIIISNNSNLDFSKVTFYLNVPSDTFYQLIGNINQVSNLFVVNDTITKNSIKKYSGKIIIPDNSSIESYYNPNIIVQSVE